MKLQVSICAGVINIVGNFGTVFVDQVRAHRQSGCRTVHYNTFTPVAIKGMAEGRLMQGWKFMHLEPSTTLHILLASNTLVLTDMHQTLNYETNLAQHTCDQLRRSPCPRPPNCEPC